MTRSLVAVMVVVLALGVGAWARTSRDTCVRAVAGTDEGTRGAAMAIATPGAGPPATAIAPASLPPDSPTEAALMERLRAADPATALAVVREGHKRYPDGAGAEERDARKIDALVQLDRIGEAHTDAMLFIQRHPSGPFSAHVMNLMGVHPRPPGAV